MARAPTVNLAPATRHSRGGLAHGQRNNPYSPTAAQRRLTADRGNFLTTFSQIGSIPQFLPANTGFVQLAGPDNGLIYNRVGAFDYGSFALSGQSATLTFSGAITPTYTLTAAYGQYYAYGDPGPFLTSDTGSFALAGQDVTLTYRSSRSDTGSFTLSGQSATLTYVAATGKNLQDELSGTLLDANGSSILDDS